MKQVIGFLHDLRNNNDRGWFARHKDRYEEARARVLDFAGKLIPGLAAMDPFLGVPESADCLFRIYRDVRFSGDKSPYKTHFGVYMSKGGRKSIYAGYYLHIEPGSSMLAGGIYQPSPEILKKIRTEVYFDAASFKKILASPAFVKYFHALDEDRLSRPPKDFPPDFPDIELLKYRSYTILHLVPDKKAVSGQFHAYCLEVFREMVPFNNFLNRAIIGT
jgi:uncharacterized protein (TIGR02453 family)